ncbi:Mammalian cell entry related domain protein [Mycolicibacterium rhodesiae JS60]|nr:Mammalian cell entry related domain protein [Mycolicibacterium rhodesiae JS60]
MLRGSAKYQQRVLTTIGVGVVLCIALAVCLIVANPFGSRHNDQFSVAVTTPYVGQGVEAGTAVVLHGVKVGQVSKVTNIAGGGVRLVTDLQALSVRGLTDTMHIDFRPINYFGVPGINLVPNQGGQALRDGSEIKVVPTGNFTLSQLLSQLGDVSAGTLTPQLIKVIDRVTRYTDGLNPLFETAVTVTRAVHAVQTVPTEQLLTNTASAIGSFPPFVDAVVTAGTRLIDFGYYPGRSSEPASSGPKLAYPYLEDAKVPNFSDETEEYWQNHYLSFLRLASDGLFASVGKLLYSHVDDLSPLISGLKVVTDTGPVLLRPQDIAQKLAELRSRFETLYAGDGQQHAISVRILLDSLPGVAAPLGIVTREGQ